MIKIKEDLAYRKNYGSERKLNQIKYIVIHYTANDGDTDEANGNYFDDKSIGTSAHYFVDDDSATRSVPDNYVAWHCGGGRQGKNGGTYLGKCTNTNSIGIEICDDVKNGTIYPSEKTIENVIELTESLMKKYKIPKENVIRHYDVTGKACPAYWCGSVLKNKKWKTAFWNKLGTDGAFLVKVKADVLNVRKGAGVKCGISTRIKYGEVYTIVATKKVGNSTWGKLKSGDGWINLYYTKKIKK